MIEENLRCKPKVSVIVLDLKGGVHWSSLIVALNEQTYRDFEIILVENGPPCEVVYSLNAIELHRLRLGENRGFAGGVLAGMSLCAGEYLALLNDDSIPEPEWLEHLVKVLDEEPEVGAVCSKVLFDDRYAFCDIKVPTFNPATLEASSTDERELGIRIFIPKDGITRYMSAGVHGLEEDAEAAWVWTKGSASIPFLLDEDSKVRLKFDSHPVQEGKAVRFEWRGGISDSFVLDGGGVRELIFYGEERLAGYLINNAGSLIGRDWNVLERGLYELDDGSFDEPIDLEAASGCSLLIKKSAIAGERLFDPEFFAYYEDVDLSRRLRKAGYRIVYEPKSRVYHKRSGTAGTQSAFQVFHATRNRFWVIAMHAPWKVVLKAAFHEMTNLEKYRAWLNEEFSLSRLKRETWFGFIKRVWRRLCDSE